MSDLGTHQGDLVVGQAVEFVDQLVNLPVQRLAPALPGVYVAVGAGDR